MKNALNITIVEVDKIKFTPENARKITEESLRDLEASIKALGVIRPLILTNEMVLMSGNQRTKTLKKMGVKEVPAVIINDIAKNDYINFTLLVNSIEYNKSEVVIDKHDEIAYNEFIVVDTNRIKTLEFRNPVVRRDIAKSVIKHGQWGNVIINDEGEVIFNSDYASIMETLGYPVTVYKVTKEQEQFIVEYFYREYGVYSYDHLNYPSFPQTYVQPARVIGKGSKGNGMRSILYDEIARDKFEEDKGYTYVDFGAGKKDYANHYRNLGYKMIAYEPFYRIQEGTKYFFDIDTIVNDINEISQSIKDNGLFDVAMCDGVLNATMTKQLELYVIATVASLTSSDGHAYFSSRRLDRLKQIASTNPNSRNAIDESKRTFELDENGMYLSYRKGQYTGQKYHDTKQLRLTLLQFFEEVDIRRAKDSSATSNFFECRKPKKIDEKFLREALNEEFNFVYPDEYRHNKHEELVELIVKANKDR